MIVSSHEKAAYENHCLAYLEQYQPKSHEETDLVQQYANQQWTRHQIAATAPFYKQLSTMGILKQRRRRAAA